LLPVERSLVEVTSHPGVVPPYLVDIRLSKKESISPVSFRIDSQTHHSQLLEGLVRASADRTCVPLLDLTVLDAAQIQSNAWKWTRGWSGRWRRWQVLVHNTSVDRFRGNRRSRASNAWEKLITNELLQRLDAFLSPFRPFLDAF
jgi:hypothetical protein